MMWDRIFTFFSGPKHRGSDCCEPEEQNIEEKLRRRRDLERREREARRMNDILEGMAHNMREK